MLSVFHAVVFVAILIVGFIFYQEVYKNEDQRKMLRDFEMRMRKKREEKS